MCKSYGEKTVASFFRTRCSLNNKQFLVLDGRERSVLVTGTEVELDQSGWMTLNVEETRVRLVRVIISVGRHTTDVVTGRTFLLHAPATLQVWYSPLRSLYELNQGPNYRNILWFLVRLSLVWSQVYRKFSTYRYDRYDLSYCSYIIIVS